MQRAAIVNAPLYRIGIIKNIYDNNLKASVLITENENKENADLYPHNQRVWPALPVEYMDQSDNGSFKIGDPVIVDFKKGMGDPVVIGFAFSPVDYEDLPPGTGEEIDEHGPRFYELLTTIELKVWIAGYRFNNGPGICYENEIMDKTKWLKTNDKPTLAQDLTALVATQQKMANIMFIIMMELVT